MADNSWLCSHVIAREALAIPLAFVPALRVHRVGKKSRNISYDYLPSWEGNRQKLASESGTLAQKPYILTRTHKIPCLELRNQGICAR
jgi:hypothetical protein